jgi:CRISPR-associated endonuclease/helicase Cas3
MLGRKQRLNIHDSWMPYLTIAPRPMETIYFRYWGKAGLSQEPPDTFHLLVYHSLDVAAVGQQLLLQQPAYLKAFQQLTGLSPEVLRSWLPFLLALHDLGKFADSFQNLNPSVRIQLSPSISHRAYGLRHDSLGWLLWNEHLRQRFSEQGLMEPTRPSKRRFFQEHPLDVWMAAVVGHHGQPPHSSVSGLVRDYFEERLDFEAASTFAIDLIPLLLGKPQFFPLNGLHTAKQSSWWLAGFAVLCDWLGSNTSFFPYQHAPEPLGSYWEAAQRQAKAAVQATELYGKRPSAQLRLSELLGGSPSDPLELTPLQQTVREWKLVQSPQMFILEDVTGAGKTEAAVLLAHRLMQSGRGSSVYFALPTMATANTMYDRMRAVYRKLFDSTTRPSLVLAHGAAKMSGSFRESVLPATPPAPHQYGDGTTSAGAHCNAWLADNRKKALLADIGVGTLDQALVAVLSSRHQSLRLLGLIDTILLVDEVHSYDPYMHELLCGLLRAHATAGGSAILLSATLPHQQRQALLNAYAEGQGGPPAPLQATELDAYPLVSCRGAEGLREQTTATRESVKRTVAPLFLHTPSAVEAVLAETLAKGQCACWIRNSVKDALEAYQTLTLQHPDWKVDLFHARFALGDRLAIEKRVVDRFGKNSSSAQRQGQVLIATQVVEQSLDLDFDTLISDLAPIDLLIQRAGRLRRHARDLKGDRIAAPDQRGAVLLHLYGPAPVTKPTDRWYEEFFPNASRVYPHHGQLWLTANRLQHLGQFRMPNDARRLIEGVYGEEAQKDIPEGLLVRGNEAEGGGRAEASLAQMNRLNLERGYSDPATQRWFEEAKAPTRLGEPTTTVYLAQWQNGQLLPWFRDERHAWPLSAVSLRTYWIDQEAPTADFPPEAIERFKVEQLPAKGQWGVLLPLSLDTKGNWRGAALNEQQEHVSFVYNRHFGLLTNPELKEEDLHEPR